MSGQQKNGQVSGVETSIQPCGEGRDRVSLWLVLKAVQ